jgi:hypothetical protein
MGCGFFYSQFTIIYAISKKSSYAAAPATKSRAAPRRRVCYRLKTDDEPKLQLLKNTLIGRPNFESCFLNFESKTERPIRGVQIGRSPF